MVFNIGIPKEIKNNENRVSIIPTDILKLIDKCDNIYIETNAGLNSNYTDEDYINVGAIICKNKEELYNYANLIVKVKEPQIQEYDLIKSKHIVFGFFHFAGNKYLIDAMLQSKSLCIAYETIIDDNNIPIILYYMSKLAGENAMIEAYKFNNNLDSNITFIGFGNVGFASFDKALQYGYKNINIIDINFEKIKKIKNIYTHINIFEMNNHNLKLLMNKSNIIIGSIHTIGKKTDNIINDNLLNSMPDNSLFVDVAIDQGGMTSQSIPTTYDNPIIKYNKINLFCVPNIPSIDGNKASKILSDSIIPYLLKILNCHDKSDIINDFYIKNGINISDGKILNQNIIN